jgi:hypothetical protein
MVESAQRDREQKLSLLHLAFVAKEFGRKGIRGRLGNRRLPCRVRGGDRLRETFKVEVVSLAEHPYIVEIFHATIGFSKRHHSLEFFCDDRLPGVRAQTRRGKIEQYGQVNFLDAGFDCRSGCEPSNPSASRHRNFAFNSARDINNCS